MRKIQDTYPLNIGDIIKLKKQYEQVFRIKGRGVVVGYWNSEEEGLFSPVVIFDLDKRKRSLLSFRVNLVSRTESIFDE